MRPSLKSIAEGAGVSINTVSDIINRNRSHLYDPRTVEKVRRISDEINYQPNRAAQALRSRRSRIIGFVAWNSGPNNTVSNSVVYPFIVGASHYLISKGYHLATVELEEIEWLAHSKVPQALDEQLFDVLILQQGLWHHIESWGSHLGAPILFWDAGKQTDTCSISRDELGVGSRLVRELAALGHKKIAYHWTDESWQRYTESLARYGRKRRGGGVRIDPRAWLQPAPDASTLLHYSFFERYEGYRQGMEEAGLTPVDLIGTRPADIAARIKKLAPTALVVLGGRHLGRLLKSAFVAGRRVPEDLSIASMDVDPRIQLLPDLDTGGMIYDRYNIGQQAAQLALRMVGGQKPESVVFGSRFHPGETVAPPR